MPQRRTVALASTTSLVVAGWLGVAAVDPIGAGDPPPRLRSFAGCAELGAYVGERAVRSALGSLVGLADKHGRLGDGAPAHPYAAPPARVRALPEPDDPPAPQSVVDGGLLATLETGTRESGDTRSLRLLDVSGDRPVELDRLRFRAGESASGLFRLAHRRVLVLSDSGGSAVLTLVAPTRAGIEVLRRAEFGGTFVALRREGASVRAIMTGGPAWRPPDVRPGSSLKLTTRQIRASAAAAPATAFLPRVRVTDARGRVVRDGPLTSCARTFALGALGGPELTAILDMDTRHGDSLLEKLDPVGVLTRDGVVHAPPGRFYLAQDAGWPHHRIHIHALDSASARNLGTSAVAGDEVTHMSADGPSLRVLTNEHRGRCGCQESLLTVLDESGGLAAAGKPYRFGERRLVDAPAGTGRVLTTATFADGEGRWNVRLDLSDPGDVRVTRSPDITIGSDPLADLLHDLGAGVAREAAGPGWQAARRQGFAYLPATRTAVLRTYGTRLGRDFEVALAVRPSRAGRLEVAGRFAGDPWLRTVLRAGSRLVAVTPRSVSVLSAYDLRVLGRLRFPGDRDT